MRRVIDRPEWRLHARLPAYRNRVTHSLEVVESWLSRCKRPYVALSGGKDSTVALALCRALCPDIAAAFFDDEFQFPETEHYFSGIPGLIRLAHPAYHAPGFTAWDYPEPPAHLSKDAIWTGSTSRPTWMQQQGYDGAAIGLRRAENMRRKIHIAARGETFMRQDNGVVQCYPVANWSTADIWTYIATTGTPYNAAYDKMERAGIELDRQRVGPIYTDQAYCGAEINRRLWPELWQTFIERYPNAAFSG